MSERLIRAAIAVCWSDSGFADQLAGQSGLYEPWPEMDMLAHALDELRPGWREDGPPAPVIDRSDEGEWTEDGRLVLLPVYYDNPDRVYAALLLVGDTEAEEGEVAAWTSEQRKAAAEWALSTYADASDNYDVWVPPRPHWIRKPGQKREQAR